MICVDYPNYETLTRILEKLENQKITKRKMIYKKRTLIVSQWVGGVKSIGTIECPFCGE